MRCDNAANPAYLKTARALVKAAHGDEAPLVVDPFAGGGSIPLEALRIGCDAFASDLNPVASLINKVLLEDIPQHGEALAEKVRSIGADVEQSAASTLAEFYPPDPDGARPITYLWARTVQCEQPRCGCEIPLVRSFWMSKKKNRWRALSYVVVRGNDDAPALQFELFTPGRADEVPSHTVNQAKAKCPACQSVLPADRVRAQLTEQRGGADVECDANGIRVSGARILAVAVLRDGVSGREYRLPTKQDYLAVYHARNALDSPRPDSESIQHIGPLPIPDEEIPRTELRRISLPIYGITRFRDMFTRRQLLALTTFATLIRRAVGSDDAVNHVLCLAIGKLADLNNGNSAWEPIAECPRHTVARHDIPMAWDFAEAVPISRSSGSFAVVLRNTVRSILSVNITRESHIQVQLADACKHPLPDDSADVWFTDPPYYDSVPYAHLSDFFHIWHTRAMKQPFLGNNGGLTPKDAECVADRPHRQIPKAKTALDFERRMASAMGEGARIAKPDSVASVVFAHKTTEGWEALLSGMIQGGWVITASWPIITEMRTRLNARDNASLAASVHLVCRPREEDAGVGDWSDIIRELPRRIADWMDRLSDEGIRGADLVFACIGPALELFSKYERVETPDGEEVGLAANEKAHGEPARRGFLSYVWEVVGRTALNQVLGSAESKARNGAAGALEEDARLSPAPTAMRVPSMPTRRGRSVTFTDGWVRRFSSSPQADRPRSWHICRNYGLALAARISIRPRSITRPSRWRREATSFDRPGPMVSDLASSQP